MSESITQARQVVAMQIDALSAMADRIGADFDAAVDIVLARQGRVVLVGMGKSGLIGKKIAATMASTGTPAFFVHPAEAFHGDLGMIGPQDVVVMISNSGETEELVRILPFLEHQENRIIAMTGRRDSTLGRHAHAVLDVSVEREACNNNLAPTSSTTATLVMGDALAVVLSSKCNFQPEDFARFHPGGSLGRRLLTRVADVMHKDNLPVCRPDASFRDVVHEINRGRLGLVLVMQDGDLQGIITDGDVRRAFDSAADYREIAARHIMSSEPKLAAPDERFSDAEARLRAARINALVVKNQAGEVVGVLQIHDVVPDKPVEDFYTTGSQRFYKAYAACAAMVATTADTAAALATGIRRCAWYVMVSTTTTAPAVSAPSHMTHPWVAPLSASDAASDSSNPAVPHACNQRVLSPGEEPRPYNASQCRSIARLSPAKPASAAASAA